MAAGSPVSPLIAEKSRLPVSCLPPVSSATICSSRLACACRSTSRWSLSYAASRWYSQLAQVIGIVGGTSAGRQEASGRFRYTNGIETWHGLMEDGPQPHVRPTARDIAQTIRDFGNLIPAIHDAPIEEIWAGLIDQTSDALPVLQAMTEPDGLVVAMGFSGHGFCLGPITGRIMAALVQGNDPGLQLDPFRIERFDGWNGIAEPITLHG